MAQASSIEWTDATWNPVRGCKKVSPGCKLCYAEAFAERFRGVAGHPYEHGFDPMLVPGKLDEPLRMKAPRKIFVNSMSDLFGEFVPNKYIAACFAVMAAAKQHTFMVLTKRAERLVDWLGWLSKGHWPTATMQCCARDYGVSVDIGRDAFMPLSNVRVGVSVEDKKYGLPRIEHLRHLKQFETRFLSIEPLLEDLGQLDLWGIHWVIIGGESGHGARECRAEWMRNIVRQCREQHVPVFVKQGGAAFSDEQNGIVGRSVKVPKETQGLVALRMKDRKGGDLLELPPDLRIREMPR